MDIFIAILITINVLNLIYLFGLNTIYLVTSVLSLSALRKYARRLKSLSIEQLLTSAGAPPISLIVPAYNEEATCVDAIRALLSLQYPDYEILVVNDGSQDQTLKFLQLAYELAPAPRMPHANLPTQAVEAIYHSKKFPKLWVIDKANGGKADALNAGLNYAQAPLFCAIDADSLLERDALLRVVRPFLENARTLAAGGIIRIVNGCSVEKGCVTRVRLPNKLLARFQVLEYLRAFLSGRMGWSVLGGTLIISGAFGLFRRGAAIEAGGYLTNTVGEDMELIVRLHRYARDKKMDYDITFIPDPVAWTECPETLKILGSQRNRWQRGLMETLFQHRRMLFNPRYGRLGFLAYPYYFFFEMLGPVLEILGYVSILVTALLGLLSWPFFVAFFLVAFIYGSIISIFSIALEELTFWRYQNKGDLGRLMLTALLESFGYRQLLTLWRVQGVFKLLFGKRHKEQWGQMQRKGFEPQADTVSAQVLH